jgi:hypothetical protein
MKHRFPPDCPKRLCDLIGKNVVLRNASANRIVGIPAGTVMKVQYSTRWDELHLIGGKCACCGVEAVITCGISNVTMAPVSDLLLAAIQ